MRLFGGVDCFHPEVKILKNKEKTKTKTKTKISTQVVLDTSLRVTIPSVLNLPRWMLAV